MPLRTTAQFPAVTSRVMFPFTLPMAWMPAWSGDVTTEVLGTYTKPKDPFSVTFPYCELSVTLTVQVPSALAFAKNRFDHRSVLRVSAAKLPGPFRMANQPYPHTIRPCLLTAFLESAPMRTSSPPLLCASVG